MGNPVVDAIMNATSDPNLRAAMLMGANMESSWNAGAVGDGGTSFGAFQIHLPAHPGVTAAQAKDPVFAVNFMKNEYQSAVNRVTPSLWSANPALAAATAAFYAERPAKMYTTSVISSKWPAVQAAMNGQPIGTPTTGGVDNAVNATPAVFDIGAQVDKVSSNFTRGIMTFANMALFGVAVLGGGLMVAVGIYLMFKETSGSDTIGKVSSGFKAVAGGPVRMLKGAK